MQSSKTTTPKPPATLAEELAAIHADLEFASVDIGCGTDSALILGECVDRLSALLERLDPKGKVAA